MKPGDIYMQRWGRTFVVLDGERDEGPTMLGVYLRSPGRDDERIGFLTHKVSGWSWACLIGGDFTESSKRYETMNEALHALVGSGRVKREYDK